MSASNNPYKHYVPRSKAAAVQSSTSSSSLPTPTLSTPPTTTSDPYSTASNNANHAPPKQPSPIRTSSIMSELGIYSPSVTSSIEGETLGRRPPPLPGWTADWTMRTHSLAAPSHDPMALTPLRAHYLKRELVTLGFAAELKEFDSPSAVSLLGHPFLPESRFKNGIPLPDPKPGSMEALALKNKVEEKAIDLPFLRFVFHQFVLTFPFLANCPPTFFSHKLQPFVHSFVTRNMSGSDERAEVTSRRKVQNKIEKHLGLIMSAAIKLKENDGKEEVVRIEDDGSMQTAVPASQAPKFGPPLKANKAQATVIPPADAAFSVNIVSVHNSIVKGRVRNKSHEEFIIRTRQKGHKDVFVARRYGDFIVRKADTDYDIFLQLRIECIEQDVASPPNKDRRKTEMKPGGGTPPSNNSPRQSFDESSSHMSAPVNLRNMPSLARERNRLTLRAYLRSLLNNPVLAGTGAFQSFLVESPIELSPIEMRDVELREEMDRIRDEEARSFRSEVDERVAELEAYLRTFREQLVQSDGLSRVFATIRRTEKVENLPVEYRKVLEWARISGKFLLDNSLASTIYQLFLGSDNSSSTFMQLKRIHGMMPYFMLRGILKISNPVAMVRAVLDLFLARPFGSSSLLQKMFSSGLNDEVRELKDDATLVANKIDDEVLCDKVEAFVDAPKEYQDRCRAEASESMRRETSIKAFTHSFVCSTSAEAENLDLMSVILRSEKEPRMDATTFQRVQRASVAYEEYKHERDQLTDPDEDEGPDNDDAWLFEDLHVLLRILTKARDKEQLIELIFEVCDCRNVENAPPPPPFADRAAFSAIPQGSTSELLKDIVTIFYEPLAKVYKAANIADSLSDLQTFLNDLIKTVEFAEDANLTDPQQTVQIFVDLVGRHEARFYHFVHQVHRKGEGLFHNLMKYIELFINFVRDGLPQAISLETLLPAGGQERQAMMAEVDSIVAYHHQLKKAHHDRLRKRMLKGKETEADADAAFVTGVMENLHLGGMMGDVADVTAEASDEEDFEDGGNATSEDEDEPSRPIEMALAPPPRSNNPYKTAMLERIPLKNPGKRKRKPIEPPQLKLVPGLVPIFVEMVRPELQDARRKTKAALGV
ncbi:BQ2448_6060 [Microbotryum intermedium]|uniref:BQ2448_6060 protein n=1 Tax=Microbotryum intermedium TaxID=269621 RepID=A0A238FIL7_9BASI|nr:BQ2448_6060 [Microbotryum intermedium]